MRRLSTHLYELAPAPGPAAPTAIQCPFAGGDFNSLREYRELLPGYRHIAVLYPGRGFRFADSQAASIGQLATAVVEEYLSLSASGPGPLLIGHSMGGYVAMETVARLESAGVTCAGLIVSSSLPPGAVVDTGNPLGILNGDRPLAEVPDDVLLEALIAGGAVPAEIADEPELLDMMLPLVRHDCTLGARYTAAGPSATVSCPLVAFGGQDDTAVPPESLAGWSRFTTGRFSTWLWPGDHFWFRRPQSGLEAAVRNALGTVSVDGLVHEQVRAQPESVAVVDKGIRYTYAELWESSGRIAGHLRARGVGEADVVGVLVDRGVHAIAAMLGVARTGAMYLPLSQDDPEQRRTLILRDAAPAVLLVDDGPLGQHGGGVAELSLGALVDDASAPVPPHCLTRGDTALYVMYTSGSTGVPKGVIIEHGGVVNLVTEPRLELTAERVVAHCASDAFDVSTFEIWGALCTGGTCVVLNTRDLLEVDVLRDAIVTYGIDTLFVTTAVLNFLAEENLVELRRLRSLVFGGERASSRHVRLMLDLFEGAGTRLVHAYGPTENTMMSTLIELDADNCAQAPIGTMLHNMRGILLSDSGAIVSGDGRGELCVAGPGLARGYLNRPELTAERFVMLDLPSGPERVYRTGDECERTSGVLRFLGRRDGMVKLRSHRIELGEVEAALCAYPDVLEAVVILDENADDPQLMAYLRTTAPVDSAELRGFLLDRLPRYMIPATVHNVTEFPLGATGKVDRNALATLVGGDGHA
ncbi:amino acid adenylation domain-containing protein [Actinocrispum wychmicini]|uniref:Amino acid adenylation domain-containing protein n=1 Tax=Actinocrispum wychmicini TaxID=1213861 RepID=A0A4R2JQS2_9PSEU|nr:amino acid adenylation domain-containing protein [Actinocrispum wychmicini]TCO61172.1 amino acid adenylation domain-containing protein [Actinocrispum wychmicini]